MDFSYYKQILNLFPETPNLKSLNHNDYIPENWPLALKKIVNDKPERVEFIVSDSKTDFNCLLRNKSMCLKLSTIEEGQIIFLYHSILVDDKVHFIDVGEVYTLKELNDGLANKLDNTKESKKKPVKVIKIKKRHDASIKRSGVKRKEPDSRWVTLAERWKKQGKT